MEFLYGIIGFMLGAVLVYWLLKRNLANIQQRVKRAEAALEQTEALNRQQATQLKKFREAQPQNLEQQYQKKFQELEQSYKKQIQELEHPEPGAAWQAEIERLQVEHRAQTQELEAGYNSRIAELEKAHQLQLKGLGQSRPPSNESFVAPAPASPAPLGEEAWRKTEAYWGEGEENSPDSSLINPFLTEASEKQRESSSNRSAEFDLAELLESEGDAPLKDLSTWQNQSQQLKEPRQEPSVSSNLDLFEVLDTETPAAVHLPEMPNNDDKDGDILPDLFSDSESSEDDLQDFLAMLQSEGESENQNGRVSSERSKISFS
jgi:hypothetical protein